MSVGAGRENASLILSGSVNHADFAPVLDWLLPHYTTHVVTDPTEVVVSPQAILLFEGQPLEYPQTWVENWAKTFPLTRLIAIHGNWNEGESRSGFPLQGLVRLYWHEVRNRLPGLLNSALMLRTANNFDICEKISLKNLNTYSGNVAIATTQLSEYCMLADVTQLLGLNPQRLHASEIAAITPPAFWIWSGHDTLHNCDFALFSRLKQQWPNSPGVAIINFPRATEAELLQRYGISYVLGKPFLVADFQQICQAIFQ